MYQFHGPLSVVCLVGLVCVLCLPIQQGPGRSFPLFSSPFSSDESTLGMRHQCNINGLLRRTRAPHPSRSNAPRRSPLEDSSSRTVS